MGTERRVRTSYSRLHRDLEAEIRSGVVSTSELLARALDAPSFREWAKDVLERVRVAEDTNARILESARRRLGRLPGVVHVSWGVKYRDGRVIRTDALVVWVDRKRNPRKKSNRIKPRIRVSVDGVRHSLPTDVQVVEEIELQSGTSIRPGRRVAVEVGSETGTLGAIVDRQGVPTAVFSGHVARACGVPVDAILSNGKRLSLGAVSACEVGLDQDSALVAGVESSSVAFLSSAATSIRELRRSDQYIPVRVLRRGGEARTVTDAVDVPATFGSDGRMEHLIRLGARCTIGGDSGAPVVDEREALIGFVVGASGNHSYVLPARRALDVSTC